VRLSYKKLSTFIIGGAASIKGWGLGGILEPNINKISTYIRQELSPKRGNRIGPDITLNKPVFNKVI